MRLMGSGLLKLRPPQRTRMSVPISIIICTRNRVASLARTLEAISAMRLPDDVAAELLVTDNGSSDGTGQWLRSQKLPNMPLRVVREPRPGQCRAYNRALVEASGQVMVFTDDDVIPPADWLEQLCRPILDGRADAVTGPVRAAADLARPWITAQHLNWLACNDSIKGGPRVFLVGANMAFSTRVLNVVPGFDPEMGPGAIGHASDTLFSLQLEQVGFRLAWAPDALVEHRFDLDRLTRRAFVSQARKRGEFNAYVQWHWYHVNRPFLLVRRARAWARLMCMRLAHPIDWLTCPTVPAWELGLLEHCHTLKAFARERRRPRNYTYCGLTKVAGEFPKSATGSAENGATPSAKLDRAEVEA